MFWTRFSLFQLAELCRMFRHYLSAGLTVQRVVERQAERGAPGLRPILREVDVQLRQGSSLSDSLERFRGLFPPLFLAMVSVGEHTGNLPEVFNSLEKYYHLEAKLRKQFWTRITPTLLQAAFAILLIAGLIYILGAIAGSNQSKPLITVYGLTGGPASLAFLATVAAVLVTLAVVWMVFRQATRDSTVADLLFLRVPVLGPCLHAIAMSRLTLAMQLTLDSGLVITKAMRLSLEATGNQAFAAQADSVARSLKGGSTLHDAVADTGLLTGEFLNIVASAEEGGRVPEMMAHQAEFYADEAARKLGALTQALAGLVWLIYAGCMIAAIFRIAGVYFSMLDGKM